MAKHNRLREDPRLDEQVQQEVAAVFGPAPEAWHPPNASPCSENRVLVGHVLRVCGEEVWVDVGFKSPGTIRLAEWSEGDPGRVVSPRPGDAVSVLLVAYDDATGSVILSRREAVRQQRWERFTARHKEDERVTGTVLRVVKGGLIVDIGFEAFLPTSQVDIRRPTNLDDYIGKSLECTILRIDAQRRSIIVSRRRIMADEHPMVNRELLKTFEAGQIRVGVVKNIADFGAFVDLGGIDGLLHVKDIFWSRGKDPRQVVSLEQRLELVILRVNHLTLRIDLGLPRKVVDAAWRTPAVLGVARSIAEGNHFEWLPILADALEEAGCADPALLDQLRGPDGHLCGGRLIDSLTAEPL